MNSILELWKKSKDVFEKKSLSQILSFIGDGKLRDGNSASAEFRQLLEQLPSEYLINFAESCLMQKFEESGLALQDIINQIGSRLGFYVDPGLYRGKQNEIGFDGIWSSKEGYSIIVEVKTTDTYRINLDTIADYRNKLIEIKQIDKNKSSILIIVGREDTGDLEAQIRGSKHAWDIRLISTESLIKLLTLKESLNDIKTGQQINELLKPQEYTRIDKLIDLIFLTTKDQEIDEPADIEIVKKKNKETKPKFTPVNFHDECISRIQLKLNTNFIKQFKVLFADKKESIGLVCSISKEHKQGSHSKFWFALHPHQIEFLKEYKTRYVAYGCGSAENTFLIPLNVIDEVKNYFWCTETEDRMYWHVNIHPKEDRFLLQLPKKDKYMDITNYRVF